MHADADPWEILQLSPDEAEREEILAAQEALLKKEKDPAARRRIEWAAELASLEREIAAITSHTAAPVTDAALQPSPRLDALDALLEGFHPSQSRFWIQRFTQPDKAWSWANDAADKARDYLMKTAPANWPGWRLVRLLAPGGWITDLPGTAIPFRNPAAQAKPGAADPFWDLDAEPHARPSARQEKSSQTTPAAQSAAPPTRTEAPRVPARQIAVPNAVARRPRQPAFYFLRRAYRQGYLGGLIFLVLAVVGVIAVIVYLIATSNG
jgi:hypothetical protein